jgi:hypothetical protein
MIKHLTERFIHLKFISQFLFLAFPILIFSIGAQHEMIYTNDSVQYLRMAHLFSQNELPLTDKWMPLYSVLIGVSNKLTGLTLLQSAFLVNTTLLIFALIALYGIIQNFENPTPLTTITACALLTSNKYFILNSLTIMAELPLLVWILVFIWFLHRTIKRENWTLQNIIILSFLTLGAIFTKYNGLVLLIILITAIYLFQKGHKKYLHIGLSLIINIIPYIIWSKTKSKEDAIVSAITKNSFIENISINLQDLLHTLIEFFFNENIYQRINGYLTEMLKTFCAVIFLIVLIILVIWEFRKHKKENGILLIFFSFLYIFSLITLLSFAGVNETNTRTLFYPLMTITIYTIGTLTYKMHKYFKIGLITLITISVIFNIYKLIETTKILHHTSLGSLNKSHYKEKGQTLEYTVNYINKHHLTHSQVHSNEHKMIPVFFNFQLMVPLPTNNSWRGNAIIGKNEKQKSAEILTLSQQILKENHLISFLGKNQDQIFRDEYEPTFNDTVLYTIKHFKDGFIIHSNR